MELYCFLIFTLLFNCIQLVTINNRDTIEDYIYMQSKAENQTKIMSCLSIIHNSISEGNEDLSRELLKKQEDPSKYYDKYILAMLNKCVNTITKEHINMILSPEKIYGKSTIEDRNLIKISPCIVSEHNMTSDEQELYDSIKEAFKVDYSKVNYDTPSFLNKNLKTISIATCVVILFLILFTLRSIFHDKKIMNKYKEE